MTTPKRFPVSDTTSRDAPLVPFILEGTFAPGVKGAATREEPDGTTGWTEEFVVQQRMDARLAQWYAQAYTIVEGRQVINPPAVIEFVAIAQTPESQGRFRQLIQDPERLVDVARIADVFVWLSDEVIERPTGPPTA